MFNFFVRIKVRFFGCCGVIISALVPFLTIKANNVEESFNSDSYPVLDAHRDSWNSSMQVKDLVDTPYTPPGSTQVELLLDINQIGEADGR